MSQSTWSIEEDRLLRELAMTKLSRLEITSRLHELGVKRSYSAIGAKLWLLRWKDQKSDATLMPTTDAAAPRILLWDLEIVVYTDQRIFRALYTIQHREVIDLMMSASCAYISHFGWKWLGDKTAQCYDLVNSPAKRGHEPDHGILIKAQKLMEQADLLVYHYGAKFDRPFYAGRLAANGLPVMPQIPQFDTQQVARDKFKLASNRLDAVAEQLGVKLRKQKKDWPGWWLRIGFGDLSAVKPMADYCKQDVSVLEEVYLKLRALKPGASIPVLGQCPCCRGERMVRDGRQRVGKQYKPRYLCEDCGHRWTI